MKTLTPEQQIIYDTETAGLEHAFYNVSDEFLKSLGFEMVRTLQLQNVRGDEAEFVIYEDGKGNKIIMLCVTHETHSEGDLLYISCYAPKTFMALIEIEYNRLRK
jgi:hypothetical protein